MLESNGEIQIETSTNQVEIDYIFIVQMNKFKRKLGVVEFNTHPEYFVSREEAERFIRTQPIESEQDNEIHYHIQGLSKAYISLKLVSTDTFCKDVH